MNKIEQINDFKRKAHKIITSKLNLTDLNDLISKKIYPDIKDEDYADAVNDLIADISGDLKFEIEKLNMLIKFQDNLPVMPTNVDATKFNIEGIISMMKKIDPSYAK